MAITAMLPCAVCGLEMCIVPLWQCSCFGGYNEPASVMCVSSRISTLQLQQRLIPLTWLCTANTTQCWFASCVCSWLYMSVLHHQVVVGVSWLDLPPSAYGCSSHTAPIVWISSGCVCLFFCTAGPSCFVPIMPSAAMWHTHLWYWLCAAPLSCWHVKPG